MTPSFASALEGAHNSCLHYIDSCLHEAGHNPKDFATVIVTLHRDLGVAAFCSDIPREEATAMLAAIVLHTAGDAVLSAQHKDMRN